MFTKDHSHANTIKKYFERIHFINYCSNLNLVFSAQLQNEWRTFWAEKQNFDFFLLVKFNAFLTKRNKQKNNNNNNNKKKTTKKNNKKKTKQKKNTHFWNVWKTLFCSFFRKKKLFCNKLILKISINVEVHPQSLLCFLSRHILGISVIWLMFWKKKKKMKRKIDEACNIYTLKMQDESIRHLKICLPEIC